MFSNKPKTVAAGSQPLEGAERDLVARCALAQSNLMSARGAWLYESLPEPLVIPSSVSTAGERVVLTGRWLAHGLFSTATLNSANQAKPGLLPIPDALSLIPGLTPRGTVEAIDWRSRGAESLIYVIPLPETLRCAARAAGHNAAVSLLRRFPSRVNLTASGAVGTEDRPVVATIVEAHARPALLELRDGVRTAARSVDGLARPASVPQLRYAAEDFLRITLATALSTFRDTRLQTAHFQFEVYKTEGPIGALAKSLGVRAAELGLPTIAAYLAKSPLSKPPLALLKPALREALQAERQNSPTAGELWVSLVKEERALILRTAAKMARSIAVVAHSEKN